MASVVPFRPTWALILLSEVHVPWSVGCNGWLARDVEGRLVPPKLLWPKDPWAPYPPSRNRCSRGEIEMTQNQIYTRIPSLYIYTYV